MKTTFAALWKEIQNEAKTDGPAAVADLKRLQHRYRIGAQISVLRHKRSLSQKELAEITGIDQAEISRIERGVLNATEDTLARIGSHLGVQPVFIPERQAVTV